MKAHSTRLIRLLSRPVLPSCMILCLLSLSAFTVIPQPIETVTVTRQLKTTTDKRTGRSSSEWQITVECGKSQFELTVEEYIDLGYWDAVHEAEDSHRVTPTVWATAIHQVGTGMGSNSTAQTGPWLWIWADSKYSLN